MINQNKKLIMKKFLAIMLLAVIGVCYAVPSKAEFKIGPRIGLNVNKLSLDSKMLDGSNRCGFTGGVQAEYMMPDLISIIGLGFNLSLMYTNMDYSVEYTGTDPNIGTLSKDTKFGKHFLEIPLNVKFNIGIPVLKKLFSPYVFTGPSVAFRLDKDESKLFSTKTSQWVWNVGLGLEFINKLQIGASYGFGMNNIMDGVELPVIGEVNAEKLKASTNYWTVTAAWLF